MRPARGWAVQGLQSRQRLGFGPQVALGMGQGTEDIPRAFWQVAQADSHTLGPHCSPQAWNAGVPEIYGFVLPRGPKGWVVPLRSKAPGGLEEEGVGPTSDLSVLMPLSAALGTPEDKGTWSVYACPCVCACVRTFVCDGGMRGKRHPSGRGLRWEGWGLGGWLRPGRGGWQHEQAPGDPRETRAFYGEPTGVWPSRRGSWGRSVSGEM